MIEINDSFEFIYTDSLKNKITINEKMLKQLNENDLSSLPKETTFINKGFEFFILLFKDNSKLTIFRDPVQCKIKDIDNNVSIYSFDHLKLILTKIIYKNPCYYSNFRKKTIKININKIEDTEIYLEEFIEIKEMEIEDYSSKINNIYKEIYEIYFNENKNKDEYTFKFISPNFNNYFRYMNINISDKFHFIYAIKRKKLKSEVNEFLSNESEQTKLIYPICGPHGTGKTISALTIHKLLYLQGIKGIYINLKYYLFNGKKWDDQLEVLIRECFFICNNEEELLYLYNELKEKNNIYEALVIIKTFISNKKINNENIYIILDQFQEKYNMNNLFDILSNAKIFLLSSINDLDVKKNLILKYEEIIKKKISEQKENQIEQNNKNEQNNKKEQNNIIRYNYKESLIDKDYYNNPIFQNLIKNKIHININDDEKEKQEFQLVYYILKKFDFVPKYFFEYLYYYDTIYDLLFYEYSNIYKKLCHFIFYKIIDLNIINKLIGKKHLVKKHDIIFNSMNELDFIKYVQSIPLKYINIKFCENGEFYFYYSFSLFATILNECILIQDYKKLFFISEDGGEKGVIFEKLLKNQFRVYKKFNIDGYFKVNSLTDMKPTKKFSMINDKYFSTKNKIFIDQKNKKGQDFDFGIYKPQTKQLLLFQSKYIINNGNVKKKSLYKKSEKETILSFNKLTNAYINNIHLLYISSIDYNYNNRVNAINTLKNNFLNCIFYSVKNDFFSFNFRDIITDIEFKDSFIISNIKDYLAQEALYNFELEEVDETVQKKQPKNQKKKGKENENEKTHKINKEEEGKDLFLLRRKKKKDYNFKEIYEAILLFIKTSSKFNNKEIINLLGNINRIEDGSFENSFKKKSEYAFIFYLKEDDFEIDFGKNLGLIIFNNGVNFILDLKENKNYNTFDDLIERFENGYLYAIGEKKSNK